MFVVGNYLMINTKKYYLISIKSIILLILLMSCSSSEKDNETLLLNDVETYQSGLSSLEKSDYKNAVDEFNNLSLNHPFSSFAKKSEIMTSYAFYQNGRLENCRPASFDQKSELHYYTTCHSRSCQIGFTSTKTIVNWDISKFWSNTLDPQLTYSWVKNESIIFLIYFISESTTEIEVGDGWDDDDDADWGSLEETKNSVKSQLAPNSNSNKDNDITREEIDSWATDLLSNKVPDKSAVVKQGIQTLQLVNH